MEEKKLYHPQKKFHHEEFPMQKQNTPGLHKKMNPVPDCGEESYKGCGKLTGRKALITGGDSGIGRAIAIAYMREGADVAINYLPQEEYDAQDLKDFLQKEGKEIMLIPGKLSSEASCKELIEKAHQQLGGLDIMVLNAGVQKAVKDIKDLTEEQIQHTFTVNVFSPMYLSKAAMEILPEGSSIIFSASAEFFSPNKVLLDYASSKFAIVGFCKALSKQVIDKGIRVNAVCPGPVWTPLEVSGGNPDEGIPKHGLDIPMKRAGQPVELSSIYVYLASEDASFVMGEVFGITGGLS